MKVGKGKYIGTREVERFACIGEDGTRYTVVMAQKFYQTKTTDGKLSEYGGSVDLILSNGRAIFAVGLEPDTFKIGDTGEIIRRVR